MRYYPTSRVITGSNTNGNEFTLDGISYKGPYYTTFEGKYYTGNDPVTGDSEELKPVIQYRIDPDYESMKGGNSNVLDLDSFSEIRSYFPIPRVLDYQRGFFFRYFAKKRNENGNLIEVNQEVYFSLKLPNSPYNYQLYHAIELYWQLTGPLRDTVNTVNGVRTSGIEDTNKRLTESKGVVFKGLIPHIGGNYSKFARPS